MKIGNDYEITTDKYQWILTHYTDGTSREGLPIRAGRDTYFPTLGRALSSVQDEELRKAVFNGATIEDIILTIDTSEGRILRAVEGWKKL